MNKTGAIIIIEDDSDDQEMFSEVFKELNYKNEIVFFNDGQEALTYMTAKTTEPFIVFSDINMPKLNGMELRKQIHENEDMRLKTIPYLFFTTSAAQEAVVDAYSKSYFLPSVAQPSRIIMNTKTVAQRAASATPSPMAVTLGGLSDRMIAWLFIGPTMLILLLINIFPLIWTVKLLKKLKHIRHTYLTHEKFSLGGTIRKI